MDTRIVATGSRCCCCSPCSFRRYGEHRESPYGGGRRCQAYCNDDHEQPDEMPCCPRRRRRMVHDWLAYDTLQYYTAMISNCLRCSPCLCVSLSGCFSWWLILNSPLLAAVCCCVVSTNYFLSAAVDARFFFKRKKLHASSVRTQYPTRGVNIDFGGTHPHELE